MIWNGILRVLLLFVFVLSWPQTKKRLHCSTGIILRPFRLHQLQDLPSSLSGPKPLCLGVVSLLNRLVPTRTINKNGANRVAHSKYWFETFMPRNNISRRGLLGQIKPSTTRVPGNASVSVLPLEWPTSKMTAQRWNRTEWHFQKTWICSNMFQLLELSATGTVWYQSIGYL